MGTGRELLEAVVARTRASGKVVPVHSGELEAMLSEWDADRAKLERLRKRLVTYRAHVQDCETCQDGESCEGHQEVFNRLFDTIAAAVDD
jgi:hypothetical protein